MEQYNYTPDIAARGLATQASRFIGILIEDIRVFHHTESAYVIEQEMTRRGYTCITFSTGMDPQRKAQYIEILEQRRVEGAILIGSMFVTEEVRQSVAQHLADIPVVVVNSALELPNTYSVLIDEERGTEDCVALLTAQGRRRLAYLMDVGTSPILYIIINRLESHNSRRFVSVRYTLWYTLNFCKLLPMLLHGLCVYLCFLQLTSRHTRNTFPACFPSRPHRQEMPWQGRSKNPPY